MTQRSDETGFGTRAIRAATRPPQVDQVPASVPIYQTATFNADDTAELAASSRSTARATATPASRTRPRARWQSAYAELSGAEAGFSFGSGMGAIHATLLSLLSAGDRVVSTRAVYGSTRALLTKVLGRLGVEVTFVDPTDLGGGRRRAGARPTRVLYLETISNPSIIVADIAALAELAHARGAAVVVDNTFASPYLCRPLSLGADLVVESATKWLGGHSDVVAGVVAGSTSRIEAIRSVAIDTGGIIAPLSAFLVLRGMQTLHVRMDRHSDSALTLARHLEAHPEIRTVTHPGLASHPQHAVAQRQLRAGGGMLAADVGSRARATRVHRWARDPARERDPRERHHLRRPSALVDTPPARRHASSPRRASHRGSSAISVGLEDVADLVADFDGALDAVARTGVAA